MAKRVYIVPLRRDVADMGIQFPELQPNGSQKSSVYDGEGQSGYLQFSLDKPGAPVTTATAWVSGPTNTETVSNPSAALDTDGAGGNDSKTTTATDLGLAAYLRERVENKDGGGNALLTPALAKKCADAITDAAKNGAALTLTAIDALINGADAGISNSGLQTGDSFGAVEDILRILSGEVYIVPDKTILTDHNDDFDTEAERATKVAAANTTYVAKGHFLVAGEAGYRDMRKYVRTGALNASVGSGRLKVLKSSVTFKNPKFAYTAAAATALKPQATNIDSDNLASTGAAAVIAVYDHQGNAL